MYGVIETCRPSTICNCTLAYSGIFCENCIYGYFAANGENGILDHYTGMGVECSRRLFQALSEGGSLVSIAAKLVKTATTIIFTNIPIYMRVEINRAGEFGPFLLRFRAISKMTSKYTCAWK